MDGVFHTILGGANIGVLVLATVGYFLRLAIGSNRGALSQSTDAIAYGGALAGILIAVLSGLSGYFGTWSMEAVRTSLLTQNKVLVTLALLGSWGLFLLMRWRLGTELYRRPLAVLWSMILVVIGFINTTLVGSMGGSASLKGTALDPVFISFNINRYVSLEWGILINVILIVVGLGLLGSALFMRRRPT
jgi:hypothetical protein